MYFTIRSLVKSLGRIEIKSFWLRTTIAVFIIGAAVVATRFTLNAVERPSQKTPVPHPIATALTLPPVIQGNSDKNVTILVLQLRNGGFVPGEVNRPAGNYELIINNVSLEREGIVRLERENGERVEVLKLERGRNLRKLVRFTPGSYVLKVANQPTWLTRINITQP